MTTKEILKRNKIQHAARLKTENEARLKAEGEIVQTAEPKEEITVEIVGLKTNELPPIATISNTHLFVVADSDTGVAYKATKQQVVSDSATTDSAGIVQLATDAEMQVTTAPPDNNHVPNVKRIYNWWWWLIDGIDNIRKIYERFWWQKLTMMVNGSAISSPQHGDMWLQTSAGNSEVKVSRADGTDTVIFASSNESLVGGGERVVTAGTTGGLFGNYTVMEEVVTDIEIINACKAASFTSANGFTNSISLSGKIMYKGQWCKTSPSDPSSAPFYIYKAFADNLVIRIPLG